MEMPRRVLLAVPLSLMPGVARAEGGVRLVAGPEGAVLTGDGVAAPLSVPGDGARLLPGLVLGGVAMAVVRFALGAMEWGVFAARRGGAVVALALEPLAWRGAGGARMATRISVAGDRVVLRRDSAVAVSATLWRREAWTDYLRWVAPADAAAPPGLTDAPARAPLEGTRQAAVAAWRRRAAVLVAEGRVPDAAAFAAAGLQDAGFSLSVRVQPSMRQMGPSRTMV